MPLQCPIPQVGGTSTPLPVMHVPKLASLGRRYWYLTHQWKDLTNAIGGGEQESTYFYYDIKSFTEFLEKKVVCSVGVTYLRIYFAAYLNKLILVYATNNPADDTASNIRTELYYMYDNSAFVEKKKDEILPLLQTYMSTKYKYTNVVYGTHQVAAVKEFKDEIKLQQPTGIKAYISSYLEVEVDQPDYANRLFVDFVFTTIAANGKEEDAYIDDCTGFAGRHAVTKFSNMELLLAHGPEINRPEFDNSTLCPPCKNCSNETIMPPECVAPLLNS